MNNLNDSLVVGVLLTVVFGAVCFYLYSRLTQNEKRVNLLENLLLDLKMSTEAQLSGPEFLGPDSVEPISGPAPLESEDVDDTLGGGQTSSPATDEQDEGAYYEEMLRNLSSTRTAPLTGMTSGSASASASSTTSATLAAPASPVAETTVSESRSASVLEAARAAVATFTSAKMENNYEAMSVKELQAAIKQRGLSPVPRVRKDLIEMLKRHDAGEPTSTNEKITLDSFMRSDDEDESKDGFAMSLDAQQEQQEQQTLDAQFGELTEIDSHEE
jgi:hypothetical protein